MECEKTTAFSLQSILNQVLKPLDVKTKFYNAEVSLKCERADSCIIPYQHHSANRRTVLSDMQVLTVAYVTCFISYFIS